MIGGSTKNFILIGQLIGGVVRDRTSSPVLHSNTYSSTGEAIGEGKLDELGGNSYKYDCTYRRVTVSCYPPKG